MFPQEGKVFQKVLFTLWPRIMPWLCNYSECLEPIVRQWIKVAQLKNVREKKKFFKKHSDSESVSIQIVPEFIQHVIVERS